MAVTWSELSAEEKVMTNGWVKALVRIFCPHVLTLTY